MNECSILWCGKYHQNWENELHCHNYFQMVGILSGSGTVYVDDKPYEIEKEQVFLLCPQQLHAIHCGEKNAAPPRQSGTPPCCARSNMPGKKTRNRLK